MIINYPFQGMRGTGDWRPNQRPENWREAILMLYPNGKAPLTAIMSMLRNEKTDDAHYHWWTKALAKQRGVVTAISGSTGSAVIGTEITFTMSANEAKNFRAGHIVLARNSTVLAVDNHLKVKTVTINGAASHVVTNLLDVEGADLAHTDTLLVIGNSNPEGSLLPDSILYDPVEYANYTQIFRTPLSHTRTARRTKLRTGDQLKEAKRECLELHGIELEKAFVLGIKTLNIGDNGKPERTTAGIKSFITTHDYNWLDESAAWTSSGEAWLDEKLKDIFLFGSQEKVGFIGNGAMLGIQKLAKARGTFELTLMKAQYGVAVYEYVTAFGRLYLKTHPLFNYEPTLQYSMMVVDTPNLVYRFIDDTKYLSNRQANDLDGEASEFLTEAGLELHHEETFAWVDNMGKDGT